MQWSNRTGHDQQFISMSNDLNCFELILSYDRDILYLFTSLSSDVTYTLSIFWVRIRCAQLLLPLFWVMRWAIGTSQVSKIIKVSRKTSNLRLWHQFWTKCGDSPPSSVQTKCEHDDFPSELSSSYSHPTVIPKWMMFPLETLRGTVGGLGNSVAHWDSSKHLWPGPEATPNYPQLIQVVVTMGNSPANWYSRSFNGKLQFSTWGFPNAMFDYWIGGQPLPVSFIPFVEMWSE